MVSWFGPLEFKPFPSLYLLVKSLAFATRFDDLQGITKVSNA